MPHAIGGWLQLDQQGQTAGIVCTCHETCASTNNYLLISKGHSGASDVGHCRCAWQNSDLLQCSMLHVQQAGATGWCMCDVTADFCGLDGGLCAMLLQGLVLGCPCCCIVVPCAVLSHVPQWHMLLRQGNIGLPTWDGWGPCGSTLLQYVAVTDCVAALLVLCCRAPLATDHLWWHTLCITISA